MKHDLILTVETGELARLEKLAARQGLTVEEVARGVLLQAAYAVELTAEDEEAIRRRALPRRRPLVLMLGTSEEYRLEKYAALSGENRVSLEEEAAALLCAQLGKMNLTADDYEAIDARRAEQMAGKEGV